MCVCRLTYGVWLLNEIVDRKPEDIKIYLMYDIACNLVRHLKVYYTFIIVCNGVICQALFSYRLIVMKSC